MSCGDLWGNCQWPSYNKKTNFTSGMEGVFSSLVGNLSIKRSVVRSFLPMNSLFTPLKTNMFPENRWLEDVFPTEMVPFSGDMLVFGDVIIIIAHPSRWFSRDPAINNHWQVWRCWKEMRTRPTLACFWFQKLNMMISMETAIFPLIWIPCFSGCMLVFFWGESLLCFVLNSTGSWYWSASSLETFFRMLLISFLFLAVQKISNHIGLHLLVVSYPKAPGMHETL